jgi:hypothetical protein
MDTLPWFPKVIFFGPLRIFQKIIRVPLVFLSKFLQNFEQKHKGDQGDLFQKNLKITLTSLKGFHPIGAKFIYTVKPRFSALFRGSAKSSFTEGSAKSRFHCTIIQDFIIQTTKLCCSGEVISHYTTMEPGSTLSSGKKFLLKKKFFSIF